MTSIDPGELSLLAHTVTAGCRGGSVTLKAATSRQTAVRTLTPELRSALPTAPGPEESTIGVTLMAKNGSPIGGGR